MKQTQIEVNHRLYTYRAKLTMDETLLPVFYKRFCCGAFFKHHDILRCPEVSDSESNDYKY